jgi:hypothetical protein
LVNNGLSSHCRTLFFSASLASGLGRWMRVLCEMNDLGDQHEEFVKNLVLTIDD